MKYYHMIIADPKAEKRGDKSTRRVYISRSQGSHPAGLVCLGVCGFHEEPNERKPRERY